MHSSAQWFVVAVGFAALATATRGTAQQQPVPAIRLEATRPRALPIGVVREQRVRIESPGWFVDPERSRLLQLELFRDLSLRLVRERLDMTLGGRTWTGRVDGYADSTALFAVADGELVGHLYLPFGVLKIERDTASGAYLVQQVEDGSAGQRSDVDFTPERGGTREITSREVEDESVVDLLVVYTRDALTTWRTLAQARASIDLGVATVNEAIRKTGVNGSVRVVHTAMVEYEESGDSAVELLRLRTPNDGYLDDVLELKDRYAADLVTLITETSDVDGRAGVGTPLSNGTGSAGFSTVRRRAVGGTTFAHELGHNWGAMHDWYVSDTAGAYAYSHGYVSLQGRFRDVMAYSDLCTANGISCPRLVAFASPERLHDGRPTGVPAGTSTACVVGNLGNPDCDADIAQTFAQMIPRAARYRDSRTALSARLLLAGQSVRSGSGRYRLTYQSDGNLCLHDDDERAATWSSNTSGTSPGEAILQTDGNFVVYDGLNQPRWASNTVGRGGTYFRVGDDGTFRVFNPQGQQVWTASGGPGSCSWSQALP